MYQSNGRLLVATRSVVVLCKRRHSMVVMKIILHEHTQEQLVSIVAVGQIQATFEHLEAFSCEKLAPFQLVRGWVDNMIPLPKHDQQVVR
jgi:hypothetical protein